MSGSLTSDKCVIVALDFSDEVAARNFVKQLNPDRCRLKIGKELFTRAGPEMVRRFVADGFDVFLDLKYHDIPNTVGAACDAAAELGCWMLNVHASGGREMMSAARHALRRFDRAPILIAVTVLTSLDETNLRDMSIELTPSELVRRLAILAQESGMDGVVCSPHEISLIKQTCGRDFLTVTPGVRPRPASNDDQKRTATPADAISWGGDYLVVGRPITQASDPVAALEAIYVEINLSQSDDHGKSSVPG